MSLYADDTCLYFSSNNPQTIANNVNEDLESVALWLNANRLLLNMNKTEYMMIGSRKKIKQFHKTGLQLYIGNEPVKEVFSCKYLGVILDPCLNWKLHVDHIRSKIIRNLFLFRKARPYVDSCVAKMLYFSIIQSHFDYCSVIWNNTAKCTLDKLRVLQNRAVRILIKACPDKRTHELYDEAKLSPIDNRWKTGNLIMLFKMLHNLTPTYLSSRIKLSNNSYNLRNSFNRLQLQKPKTENMRRSFLYSSTKLFNSLSQEIRNITNVNVFIRTIRNLSL